MMTDSRKFGLLAILMAAGMLAACGDSERFQNDEPASPTPSLNTDSAGPDRSPQNDEAFAGRANVLIRMCIAEGASAEVCTCQIKAVEDALEVDDFLNLIELAEAGDESTAQSLLLDIMNSDPDVAVNMSNDMLACAQN